MSRKTAVAAPAQPPFDDLLAAIDAMDGPTLRAFIAALRERYGLAEPPIDTTVTTVVTVSPATATISPLIVDKWWVQ